VIRPALLLLALTGCATPQARFEELAARAGLQSALVPGTGFSHRVYRHPGRGGASASRLHVYLDGDGSPWTSRRRVAPDPTPRNPLMLQLLTADPAPALYLGRPCYLGAPGLQRDCGPYWWTAGRYAPAVVDSLAVALGRLLGPAPRPQLTLIGFSGGGTLALLLAAREPAVAEVVTLAGNLDVAAWTARHGYSPLRGSLDPARLPPLPPRIRQVHLLGRRDPVIPREAFVRAVRRQPGAQLHWVAGYDHSCCWTEGWAERLAALGLGP
jgi:pimeloyl-ACP methyl ester carboxylesterase